MKKKVIFIVGLVILFLIIFEIYNLYNHKEKLVNEENANNILNSSKENISNETLNSTVNNEDALNSTTNTNSEEMLNNTTNANNEEINNTTTNTTNEEVSRNTTNTNNKEITEKTHISPSGFMGSSLYRVVLYTNGNVYVQTFDGNGYERENIISEELVAKNVKSIKAAEGEEHYGEVIVEGGEKISEVFGWITFK